MKKLTTTPFHQTMNKYARFCLALFMATLTPMITVFFLMSVVETCTLLPSVLLGYLINFVQQGGTITAVS